MAEKTQTAKTTLEPVTLFPALDVTGFVDPGACHCTDGAGSGSGGTCMCGAVNGGGGGS